MLNILSASLLLAFLTGPRHSLANSAAATAVLDTAIARMGGMDSLKAIQRVRFEMLTQWQRTAFDARPYPDQPVYELHNDVRDYTIDAWRNSRRFGFGSPAREIVDVVRDSVAIRRSLGGSGGVASPAVVAPGAWTTINVAYVQEKNELFAVAPERLLLGARSAGDLALLADTSIAGAAHARVHATVNGFPMTIFIRRSTGYLSAARFTVNEDDDFGLAPWGDMEAEYWYSGWRRYPSGISYPSQFDVKRVGQPYKRMSLLSAVWHLPASPDSFVVSDSLRSAFPRVAHRPMHDIPLDSALVIEDGFVAFNTPGAPVGAVRVGGAWLLLEGGQAPLTAERAVGWLAAKGDKVAAAVVTSPSAGNGGAAWLGNHGVVTYAAPGAAPFMDAVVRGHHVKAPELHVATSARWVRVGTDSVRLEPLDLADAPGAMAVYVPSLEWAYLVAAANPLHFDRLRALVRQRGWDVTRIGSGRALAQQL